MVPRHSLTRAFEEIYFALIIVSARSSNQVRVLACLCMCIRECVCVWLLCKSVMCVCVCVCADSSEIDILRAWH